jgi:hypothetical protein
MAYNSGMSAGTRANLAFSALLYALHGWGVLEAQLIVAKAGLRLHLVVGTVGLVLSAVAFCRCRAWWPALADWRGAGGPAGRARLADLVSCIALACAGSALGLCAKSGSIGLFASASMLFSVVPWSRIGFCRRQLFNSCALLVAGTWATLFAAGPWPAPIITLVWAWGFWLIAVAELLVTFTRARPALPSLR